MTQSVVAPWEIKKKKMGGKRKYSECSDPVVEGVTSLLGSNMQGNVGLMSASTENDLTACHSVDASENAACECFCAITSHYCFI